jgi:hypothetical protein
VASQVHLDIGNQLTPEEALAYYCTEFKKFKISRKFVLQKPETGHNFKFSPIPAFLASAV